MYNSCLCNNLLLFCFDSLLRWVVDGEWSTCSALCADDTGGVSTRLVYCVEELPDGSTQRTLDKLCNSDEKPATERSCSSDVECPKWVPGPWSSVRHDIVM